MRSLEQTIKVQQKKIKVITFLLFVAFFALGFGASELNNLHGRLHALEDNAIVVVTANG